MGRVTIKTDYTVMRHGEETPVVQLKVTGDADMVGKDYTLKVGSPIYYIKDNVLTEKDLRRSKEGDLWYVEEVLAVPSELSHPSTWNQNTNIFLVNGNEYVYFGSVENWTGIVHILKSSVVRGADRVEAKVDETFSTVNKILILFLLAYIGFKLFRK